MDRQSTIKYEHAIGEWWLKTPRECFQLLPLLSLAFLALLRSVQHSFDRHLSPLSAVQGRERTNTMICNDNGANQSHRPQHNEQIKNNNKSINNNNK